MGSFLNVVIYRLPAGQSIVRPGSRCGSCATPIAWYDNVPVLSYLLLRGRCRHCGARFSVRYPLVEAATAAVSALVFWQCVPMADLHHLAPAPGDLSRVVAVPVAITGLHLATWLFHFSFFAALIAVLLIDIDHFIIPNEITYAFIPLGLLGSSVLWYLGAPTPHPAQSALGIVAGGGLLLGMGLLGRVVFRKEAMGMGDVKLLAMIGAFLGAWPALVIVILLSAVGGSLVGIALRLLGRAHRGVPEDPRATGGDDEPETAEGDGADDEPADGYYIPYGPYLVLAAFVTYMVGDILVAWYQGAVLL